MDVVSVSTFWLVAIAVFIAVLFASSLFAVVSAVNKSNHDFYNRREDASNIKILQLEAKVSWLERRLDEVTQQLLRRYDDPKGDAVAP